VSEPHLIVLTCEPHTVGTRTVLICHITVNLGRKITCNVWKIILWHHTDTTVKFVYAIKHTYKTLTHTDACKHCVCGFACVATAAAQACVWSYMTSSSWQSKQILSLSICSVVPFLVSTTSVALHNYIIILWTSHPVHPNSITYLQFLFSLSSFICCVRGW